MMNTGVRERAILVGVATPSERRGQVEDYLEELARLADSAGAEVVHRLLQVRHSINAAFFIGKGKAEELAYLAEEKKIDIIIFDDDLSAVQVRNLEKLIKCKIIDRSGIILDIFASRARTNEAKTQVELAQLQYMLPRLTRQWTHLSKQFGGIGTKGPGETQIEIPPGGARRIYERRQIDAPELVLRRRRGCRRHALRHARLDSQARPHHTRTPDSPFRYRRVHPQAPPQSRRVVQEHA